MRTKTESSLVFPVIGLSFLLFTGCNSPGFCTNFPNSPSCPGESTPETLPSSPSDPSSPSEAPSPSDPPLDGSKGSSTFPVLYFINTNPPSGGASEVFLEIEPTSTGKLDIKFGGSGPGSTGPWWEASAWMSAANVSFLLGDPMQSYEIELTADVDGQIDGPSAGGVTTAAILAALRGDTIRSDVAMTGTINPDGTIGPVGGIEQKLEGAKEENKSIVLIPYEQQNQAITNQAKRLNLELQEVADIYEAYEALTDQSLPKLSAPSGRIQLSSQDEQQILQKAQQWEADYLSEKSKLPTINRSSIGEIADAIDSLLYDAENSFAKAGSYENNGDSVGAYQKYSEAAALMQAAADLARFFDVAEYGTESDMEAQLVNSWESASSKIDSLLTRLQALEPETASNAIAMTQAYAGLSLAQGLLDYAQETFEKSSSLEELGSALAWVVTNPALANAQITYADHLLDLGWGGDGSPLKVSQEQLKDFSNILQSAAEANLAFIDSFLANQFDSTVQEIQQAFPTIDYQYGFARGTLNALSEFETVTEQAQAYADLGSGLSSYYWSSRLIAQYYSLEAQFDDNDEIVDFGRPRSLIFMLDSAETRAEEMIALAEKLGNNPNLLVFSYETAKLARSGSPEDQMNALGELWYSIISGRLMAIFAGESLIVP